MFKKSAFTVVFALFMTFVLLLSACTPTAQPTAADSGAKPEDQAVEPVSNEPAPAKEQPAEEPAAPVEVTTINVMTFFASDNPTVEESVVAAFEAAHPEIDVELEVLPFSDLFTKLRTVIAGGDAPDVSSMNYENLVSFASEGVLVDLNPFIERDGYDLSQLFASAVDMHNVGGQQVGMPATFSDVVLYYNKDLFDAAGVPYPDETWDIQKVIEAGPKLSIDSNNDGVLEQAAYTEQWWPIWLEMYGGSMLTEDKTKCAMTTPESIEAVQMMTDLMLKYKVSLTRGDLATQGEADRFIAGTLAMLPSGPWMLNQFHKDIADKFQWDITLLPAGKNRVTHTYGNSYVMLGTSEKQDAAWEFIKFATGPEGGRIRQAAGYELSPVKEVMENEFVKGLEGKPPAHADIFLKAMDYAVKPPSDIPTWEETNNAIWAEIELALSGQKTVEEAMQAACETVDPILAGQ